MDSNHFSSIEDDCPIPNSHRRLIQAHKLWHQTLDAYQDPDGFLANLNATIEALRNTTFMLQAEKKSLLGFETWYPKVQGLMKNDEILKWICDSRTTVVHKSDLETQSFAEVVVYDNLDLTSIRFDFPVISSIADALKIALPQIPRSFAEHRENLVFSMEKIWVSKDFPQMEILEALALAYTRLSRIIQVAHSLGVQEQGIFNFSGLSVPICMRTTKELRTLNISLATGEEINPTLKFPLLDSNLKAEALKRYGEIESIDLPFQGDPIEGALKILKIAQRVLRKDGSFSRTVYLRSQSGWRVLPFRAESRVEKFVLTRKLVEEIKRIDADAVIDIGEAWMAPPEAGRFPGESAERQEILYTAVLTKDGINKTFLSQFSRSWLWGFRFEEPVELRDSVAFYLSPLLALWGIPLVSDAHSGTVEGP
jgi:hypothetical protein